MSGAVTKVWDTGGTAFSTASHLKSLIQAVTVENVQAQAVLAAETLGFGIPVRKELLGKAIEVLQMNESVRWENLKILIGIRSGDLQKMIRGSTPLLSFFLFTCACKICFTDTEIGDLASQMIMASGIINKFPVAAFQLSDLIKSFSGHAAVLAPAGLLHALAVEMAQQIPRGLQLYRRLDMRRLGVFLTRLFELLNDESVDSIIATGGTDGLWLATFLSWLMEGRVCISIDGKMLPNVSIDGHTPIRDTENSKLSLQLKTDSNEGRHTDDWIISEWRKGQPTEFVVEEQANNRGSLYKYMPISMTRTFLLQSHHSVCSPYFAEYPGPFFRARVDSVVGALASALIVLLSRSGSIYESYGLMETNCPTSSLWDIFPEKWLKVYESAITHYGWLASATVEGQRKALDLLEPAFLAQADRHVDHGQTWHTLRTKALEFIVSEFGHQRPVHEVDNIFNLAAYVATNAVATATCDFHSGVQRIAPPSEDHSYSAKAFFGALLSPQGMDISQFRAYSFAKALPGVSAFDANDLVLCSDGYTAGIGALWNFCNAQKRNALALRVCIGVIQRNQFRYDNIRERFVESYLLENREFEQMKLFEGTKYLGLYPKADQHSLRAEHLIAECGKRLELMSYLTTSARYIRPVSWTQSIHGLVLATHFEETSGHSENQEKELAQTHAVTFSQVCWRPILYVNQVKHKTIFETSGNLELRFFSCGIALDERRYFSHFDRYQIVIRHSASLLSTVLAAEALSPRWAIIC